MPKDLKTSLSQRVVRGGIWVFALRITDRIFYIARLIILARILAPRDFGLLGIAMLTMMTLENFSQTGFEAALIQKKEKVEQYLDSAWTFGIIRGFFLFAILYLTAPYASKFFETPQAEPIIRVIGFSLIIQAFTNIGIVFFKKELEFNKQFIYQLSGTLADFTVALLLAFLLKSVWALVFGLIAGNITRLIISYIVHPYRPRLSKDWGKVKELFKFGKWILGSSFVVFLLTQGDNAVVGKILGVASLGFYQMAYRFAYFPTVEIAGIISLITFPAYSKMQNDIPRLRESYLKVLRFISLVSFPAGVLIFVLAADFTKFILGDQWLPIVPVLKILSVYGVIGSINGSFGPVLRGLGVPHTVTVGSIAQLIILIAIIFPLTFKFGMIGTAMSIIISAVCVMGYFGSKIMKIFHCKAHELLNAIFPPLICSMLMFLVVIISSEIVHINYNRLIVMLTIGIISYSVSLFLIYKIFKIDLWAYSFALWTKNGK